MEINIAMTMPNTSYSEIDTNHRQGSLFLNEYQNTSDMYDAYMDYDYGSMYYIGEIKKVLLWEYIIKISVYVVIMLVALTGNFLILIVVSKNRRLQTTTNFYIVNLAVSDILVTVFCTWVKLADDLTEGWILGGFFCKMNSFAQVLSLVASILSLLLIALDRFFGIVFAMKAHLIELRAKYSIVLIWLAAFLVAAPLLVVRQMNSIEWLDHVEIWCYDRWPMVTEIDPATGMHINSFPGRQAYYAFLSIVLFFLPIILMTFIFTRIIMTVWSARTPGETIRKRSDIRRKVKRKVVKMLVLILASFGVCWLPLMICILYSEFRTNKLTSLPDTYYYMEFVSYTLAYSNSAINPIIYAGFNENFRKGFFVLFGCYSKKMFNAMYRMDSVYTSTTFMTKAKRKTSEEVYG